jgi:flagellar protein FlaI
VAVASKAANKAAGKLTMESLLKVPHLTGHLRAHKTETGREPEPLDTLENLGDREDIDIIYKVSDLVYVHIFAMAGQERKYLILRPELTEAERKKYDEVLDIIFQKYSKGAKSVSKENFSGLLNELFDSAVTAKPQGALARLLFGRKALMTPVERDSIKYLMLVEILGLGTLQPLLEDPYLEDIFCIGISNLSVIHKKFGTLETNVKFPDAANLDTYLRRLTERMGKPVSISNPVVDLALPDGSRANIIYSDDVSVKGPSFSLRRTPSEAISITQLVAWNTLSAELAAYLWLCLENGMSIMYCGESACGKTATLNACLPFIRHDLKIYSVEDTMEITPPHSNWQRLLTRETGPEDSRVLPFDLLRAALRSRPNYIIAGEIRGVEGAVAFQAMQTGHPVLGTFHASSIVSMIQRFTSEPINVPATFMDNLNIAVIQTGIKKDGKLLRRVVAVGELLGYSRESKGVLNRNVFGWDPITDAHRFRGMNNSYILENKIALTLGYADKRKIYDDMMLRTRIIETMVKNGIFKYDEVTRVVGLYYNHGINGLPFPVS